MFPLLESLLGATALMQAFPQHATPVYQSGVTRLRARVIITRIEFRLTVVGSVSNTLTPADYYNNVRMALIWFGKSYSDTNVPYLKGVQQGTTLQDVDSVLFDKIFDLPAQAFDPVSAYAVPQVVSWVGAINCNRQLQVFSTNSSGVGAAWDTDKMDLVLEHISDSSVAPHPTVQGTVRLFLEIH